MSYQVPLSITDSHHRALAFHRITEGIADYALAIANAGSVHECLTIHQELKCLAGALEAVKDRAIDTADEILKEK